LDFTEKSFKIFDLRSISFESLLIDEEIKISKLSRDVKQAMAKMKQTAF
jgi:hypothetical protein